MPVISNDAFLLNEQAVKDMEALGRSGITVAICCGPKRGVFAWSVFVMSRDGQEFQMPFQAASFAHAVQIAQIESAQRGWVTARESHASDS